MLKREAACPRGDSELASDSRGSASEGIALLKWRGWIDRSDNRGYPEYIVRGRAATHRHALAQFVSLGYPTMRHLLPILLLALCSGCAMAPQRAEQVAVHNPFPQLSRVAVAPFFNLSAEPSVDGREFALAYFNELQLVPGYEVVPVGVVEQTLEAHRLSLGNPADARKLARVLGVDAVVIGAVTDYSPYYPPRCGLRVEWYAADPTFHPIPPGYGLSLGTPEEKHIPEPLIFDAQMALARAEMKPCAVAEPAAPAGEFPASNAGVQHLKHESPAEKAAHAGAAIAVQTDQTTAPKVMLGPGGEMLPPGELYHPAIDPSELAPMEPVIRHTKTYNGHDPQLTTALCNYYAFRDDGRFGGWQSYLARSDDFVRFCCHLHVSEMLQSRGGAGETQVVWRWPANR